MFGQTHQTETVQHNQIRWSTADEGQVIADGGQLGTQSKSTSSRAGMRWSSARWTITTPTKFIEHVTILIHMAPKMTSWNSWVENMVDPTIWTGLWSSASSGGTPVPTWGGVISSQGLCYFHKPWQRWWSSMDGVFLFLLYHWTVAVGLLAIWVVVWAFGHPLL